MHYTVTLVTLNAVLSELITVITFDEMSEFNVVLMEVYVRRRNGCLCLKGTRWLFLWQLPSFVT